MATSDYEKDPDAVLDYTWDWADWLEAGETITASSVFATAGIVLDSDDNEATRATAWLSGGSNGVVYEITNRISTTLLRTDDRTITIRVTNR